MRATLNGLHLWTVTVGYSTSSLFIVTRKKSIDEANRKTRTFLRTPAGRNLDAKGAIRAIVYEGTIDA